MRYSRTARFHKSFAELPAEIQEKARRAFLLFRDNPRHPSLVTKKIEGRSDVWEGRIDQFYRFTFHYGTDEESGETTCWFRNIGPHDIVKTDP
jgi:mRNA interferase RelE/StbE